jgi:hypothetical protein
MFTGKPKTDKKSSDKAFDMMTTASDKTDVDFSKLSSTAHTVLAGAGMIPAIGNVADVMDAVLYGLEGDKYGVGLSLMSALPMVGLMAGGIKLVKGGKKAANIAKIQKRQVTLVEGAQEVVRQYGFDPNDAELVSNIADTVSDAAEGLMEAGRKYENLLSKGIPTDDAQAVMTYLDHISPRAIKAAEDFKKMGYDELEFYGKEAVDEMNRLVKKGKELYKTGEMNRELPRGGYNIYERMMEGKSAYSKADRELFEILGVKPRLR